MEQPLRTFNILTNGKNHLEKVQVVPARDGIMIPKFHVRRVLQDNIAPWIFCVLQLAEPFCVLQRPKPFCVLQSNNPFCVLNVPNLSESCKHTKLFYVWQHTKPFCVLQRTDPYHKPKMRSCSKANTHNDVQQHMQPGPQNRPHSLYLHVQKKSTGFTHSLQYPKYKDVLRNSLFVPSVENRQWACFAPPALSVPRMLLIEGFQSKVTCFTIADP